jgi:hypothetical protein
MLSKKESKVKIMQVPFHKTHTTQEELNADKVVAGVPARILTNE